MTRRALVLLRAIVLLLGIALPVAFAPRLAAAQEWTYATSEHFEVYTTGGARRAREALEHCERVHAFFADVVRLESKGKVPVRLIVLSGQKEFQPYAPNEVAAAYYLPGPGRDYIVMRSLDDQAYRVVVHEYVHLLSRQTGKPMPLWLNEGMAEFYSTVSPYGGKMSVGRIPEDRLSYLAFGASLLPLEDLFAVGHDSSTYNTKDHAGTFYSQSWALTHMLMMGDKYSNRGSEFIAAVHGGADPVEALRTYYGKSTDDAMKDLRSYIRQDKFRFVYFDYKNPKIDRDFATAPVSPYEADLVTANLLAHLPAKVDEARKVFDRLLGENPDRAELHESLGYFELRRRQREQAIRHFARAAELGSKNMAMYRDYGMVLPSSEAAAKQLALLKAIELGDTDLDTKLTLASSQLGDKKSLQALVTLNQVTSVTAERAFMLFQLKASAAAALERWDEAKESGANAVKYAQTPTEKDFAARLVKYLDDASTYKERLADAEHQAALQAERQAVLQQEALQRAPAGEAREAKEAERTPRLMRREGDPPLDPELARVAAGGGGHGEELLSARGRFVNLNCKGPTPVFEFDVSGAVLRLLLDAPSLIELIGAGGATMELNCGPQGRLVKVSYIPEEDARNKTSGKVRVLDFR